MRWGLFAPRYWPTWFGLGVLRLLALLPYPALLWCGRALGTVVVHLPIRFVRTARRNIELCLPELQAPQRERLLRAHFRSLGIGLMEVPLTWWSSTERLERLVHLEGIEHLEQARARGRGVIVLTAHFTTLELAGRTLLRVAPVKFLYRATRNEVVAYALQNFRTGLGGAPIPHDDIRAFIGALRRNECVWYAPDQSYRKKGAEMVPVFGIPAATNTLTSRLARLTGATVLPYFLRRLPGKQGYLATIHPPLENFPSDDPVSDAARFNRIIEAQVRLAPEQYLWIHRRFKGLSADYPDYYGERTARQV
ncbi:MAG: LpxL/LpxP family Kdo(2)-lipid IV(A) lauroyl/palmitoleoyl acyltransferase [Gammaproteobacteria bacterium]|nr:LpxL/LpxP family Kdo(2)-lipid IV(A) lauroyl/palmitoleoyl acyltransferase [Gammaproteobacteria bacterium]